MNNVKKLKSKEANIYHPGGDYWEVAIGDETVDVANYGDGPVALGLIFQEGQAKELVGRAAEAAVNKFMGWDEYQHCPPNNGKAQTAVWECPKCGRTSCNCGKEEKK